MAGMLQILTYLLCVYLVFKGFEIFQLALLGSKMPGNNKAMITLGVVWLIAAVILAIAFAYWQDSQAMKMAQGFAAPRL